MDKRTEFNSALKTAMKERDQVTISTVRLIMAALKDRDIAARTKGKADGIGDQEISSMLQSMIKQRQESAETYEKAGRGELAEREMQEIKVIERFLPKQLSDDELQEAVNRVITETGASDIKDMGKVMGKIKSLYAGQIDMAKAGVFVKEILGV